jgi:hypothetical protein
MKKIYSVALLCFAVAFSLPSTAQLISTGGSIVVEDGAVITIKGNLSTNAPIQGANKIVLQGTSAQTISTNGQSLYNLQIDNKENVRLQGPLKVANQLSFVNGKLLTDIHHVQVDGSMDGYGADNYVVTQEGGKLVMKNSGAAPLIFPVGSSLYAYQPLTLINAGTADTFRVGVTPNALAYGTTGDSVLSAAVDATWHVEEAVQGGSNVTLTVQWNGVEERERFDRSKAYLSHFINNTWDVSAMTGASGNDPYTISRSGITSFSPFSVQSAPVPLPLHLLNFTAQLVNQTVNLNWQTAQEVNTSHFEVERSGSASVYATLGKVGAAQNSVAVIGYSFMDQNPHTGLNVYRLKMVDKDGSFRYSPLVSVKLNVGPAFQVFPNPASNVLYVQVNEVKENALLQIFDLSGRKIKEQKLTASGAVSTSINIAELARGNYQLHLINGGEKQVKQFVKN